MIDHSGSAIPRPLKETGKSPGAKVRRSAPAWKRSESKNSHWLVQNDAPDNTAIMRAIQSKLGTGEVSGRVGHNTGLQFDSVSRTYIGETKRRDVPKWMLDAWVQVVQLAHLHNKAPVLFLDLKTEQSVMVQEGKSVPIPPMHVITPNRHAELLYYEKLVQEAKNLGNDTPTGS